ncbi:type IV toxin-antitoxin system AbiEi family antitoxin [Arthrobacter oryzae]|nr:type IV toxin-antitoxin system AbiEi family antitoxin [Arthrobacter oryzae]
MAVRPRAPTTVPANTTVPAITAGTENTAPQANTAPSATTVLGPPGLGHGAPGPPGPGPEHCALYSPGAMFSWPELQAMASDGLLTQLYQRGYLPPGVVASPQLRARAASLAVAPAIRQRVVAGRMTAAWIYGCAAEPDRLALLVDANRRISSLRSMRGCTFHEVRLGPLDVVSMGGLMVSSPLRTAVDVALHVEQERAVPALRALLARPELGVRLRLLRLAIDASPRLPYKRAALAKLAAIRPRPGDPAAAG